MNGIELKEFRKKYNLTQKELSEIVKSSIRAVQSWEQGQRNITQSAIFLIKNYENESIKKGSNVNITPNNKLIIYAPVISQYSYTDYLTKFNDDTYIKSLPSIPIFFDKQPDGIYRAFEAQGDSMNDGSIESIKEGDTLLSREIIKEFWKYKFMNNWIYVIVHKTEGIIVKKITDHEVEKGIIKTHSLNQFYKDEDINLKDVHQLFNVVQIQRKV